MDGNLRSTTGLIPVCSLTAARDHAVCPAQSNCSSGSSRVCEIVRTEGGIQHHNVSDKVRAMELAIIDELPNTTHRWCKWHVLKKAKERLGVLYGKKSEFKKDFQMLVHHVLTKEEFENGWAEMLAKYGLQKHPFLTQIYEVRHKWAKPYFMGVFCANMTSTRGSESANHLLKGYVPWDVLCIYLLSNSRRYYLIETQRKAIKKNALQLCSLEGELAFGMPCKQGVHTNNV